MIVTKAQLLAAVVTMALLACKPKQESEATAPPSASTDVVLFTVGSMNVYQSDLDHDLKERHDGRKDEAAKKIALAALVERAQMAQAAKEVGLENDPVVRAELSRVLATRYKEQTLNDEIKAIGLQEIPEARLKEIYLQESARFAAPEKRQVAVLWLNPNGNPERQKQYVDKLTSAREWLLGNPSVNAHPEQGFSVLSVDHSEHMASRYKGGVIGWLEAAGGFDPWSKALASIAFTLKQDGAVSDVIVKPEGVFLVRLMKRQVATNRPFDTVVGEIKKLEQQRLRSIAEKNFKETIAQKHPVIWQQKTSENKP